MELSECPANYNERGHGEGETSMSMENGQMTRVGVLESLHLSIPHSVQLEIWDNDKKALEWRQSSFHNTELSLYYEIYQLISLYALFQGCIFTAVAQSTILGCSHLYSPISLSVAVSTATFFAVLHKFYSIGNRHEDLLNNNARKDAYFEKISELRRMGSQFNLERGIHSEPQSDFQRNPFAGCHEIFSLHGVAVLAFLVGFSLLIVFYCIRVLCSNCNRCA